MVVPPSIRFCTVHLQCTSGCFELENKHLLLYNLKQIVRIRVHSSCIFFLSPILYCLRLPFFLVAAVFFSNCISHCTKVRISHSAFYTMSCSLFYSKDRCFLSNLLHSVMYFKWPKNYRCCSKHMGFSIKHFYAACMRKIL